MPKFSSQFDYLKKKVNATIYNNDEELISSPSKKNMDLFVWQGMLGTSYALCSSGIFLTGYLFLLGATDMLVSFIPTIGQICGLFITIFVPWVQRQKNRKKLLIPINITSKLFTISSIFVPLLVPRPYAVGVAFTLIILGSIFSALNGIIFNTWYIAIVPFEIRGRYFGIRQTFVVLVSIIVPFLASLVLDFMRGEYIGFVWIFMCALVFGAIEMISFSKIDEVEVPTVKEKQSVWDCIRIPLKNKPFMNYIIRTCLFQLFFFTAASMHQVYMMKYLKLSYSYIYLISPINLGLQMFIFLKFWGIISDKLNSNFVFTICTSLMTLDIFIWMFITPKTMYIIFPLLYIVAGVEWAGYNITVFNRRYELAPEENRVMYDAFFFFAMGITSLCCPLLSSLIRNIGAKIPFVTNFQFGDIRLVFFCSSFALFLLALSNIRNCATIDEHKYILKKESYQFCFRVLKRIFRIA